MPSDFVDGNTREIKEFIRQQQSIIDVNNREAEKRKYKGAREREREKE
jgi:hypothetical protein